MCCPMKSDHGETPDPGRAKRLLDKLSNHPGMMERFEAILDLTESPTMKADQIEELLVAEVRRLGNKAMQEWAQGAEEQGAQELQQKTPGANVRKKRS